MGPRWTRVTTTSGAETELQQRLELQEARAAELEAAHVDLSRQLAERDTHLRQLEAALARARTTILRMESELLEARAHSIAGASDDLKVLRGIGPSLERALHSLGVRNFEQIASWTEEDVWEIAGKLRTSPERILRYDWIGGAREELERKPAFG